MTVTVTSSSSAYDGNGVTVDFNTVFFFWDDAEVKVYLRVKTTGIATLQVDPTHYSISNHTPGAAGEVNFVTAPTSAQEVQLVRQSKRTQDIDLTPTTKFPSAIMEEALDRMMMLQQENFNALQLRGVRVPETEQDPDDGFPNMELPDKESRSVSGATFGFNSSGEPIILTGVVPTGAVTVTEDGKNLIEAVNFDTMRSPGILNVVKNGDAGKVDVIDADTIANQPAAGPFGEGFYYSTDEHKLYYCNASTSSCF